MNNYFIAAVGMTVSSLALALVCWKQNQELISYEKEKRDLIRNIDRLENALDFSRKERFSDLCEFAIITARFLTSPDEPDTAETVNDCK